MTRLLSSIALVLLTGACSGGEASSFGASEPFRIRGAQFFEGPLPALPPTDAPYVEGQPPQVRLSTANYIVSQGQGGSKLTGRITENAWSAGVALEGVGTGWWMLGAGDVDSTTNPPSFSISGLADYGNSLPLGPTFLLGVALDKQGHGGPLYPQALCIASNGSSGNAACGGSLVPAAAITLTWDTQMDLDLQVLTPDGKLVTPKHPGVHDPPKTGPVDPNLPHINRDSNPNCIADGARSESLIWPTLTPDEGETEFPSGRYLIYVNLFDPCGQQAARFHVRVTTAVPGEATDTGAGGGDGADVPLVEQTMLDKSGEVIAIQAKPTDEPGLFVTQYDFP